ncbi:MAG TPA: radical SAM protein [Gemmataceae bacterium]|nr:radical SAM protein [Gemmataceae bacterium]
MRNIMLQPEAAQTESGNESNARTLPRIECVPRPGTPILGPSPIPHSPHLKSLELTRGCTHRCAFCSAHCPSGLAGGSAIYLYSNTAECLAAELRERSNRPWAVYVSPNADPFPPLLEVQSEACRTVEVLASHGIDALLMTRGYIRPSALQVLARHRERLRITIPLTTMDRGLQRSLEPFCASPRLRVRQIGKLRDLGIKVQVSLEPLVPGVSDTRSNFIALLDSLAEIGIRHVQAGYLFLRPGMTENLHQALASHGGAEAVLDAYSGGPTLQVGMARAACFLPKTRRQRGYAALMALGAERGITVSVSGALNPDFRSPQQLERPRASWQPLLPVFNRTCSRVG